MDKVKRLAILDKDGTLVGTKSGETFVQHPEDQILLPGVEEAIARLVDDGYELVIASNQGGCLVRTCIPIDFPVGAYYVNGTDKPIKVIRKKTVNLDGGVVLDFAEPRSNGKYYAYFMSSSQVKYQYKTLEDAIDEMRYCLSLLRPIVGTSINNLIVYFCPDNGETCWLVKGDTKYFPPRLCNFNCGNYRKPNPEMLFAAIEEYRPMTASITNWHKENCIMIGDRNEDEMAAFNANIKFLWADEWRGAK